MNCTQYISKYRQIILKLEGIDKFQKVCGFLCELHHDYKTKIKMQNSKTMNDAIKSVQVLIIT